MTENNRFDILIVGAGEAGIPLAHDLAKAGESHLVQLALALQRVAGRTAGDRARAECPGGVVGPDDATGR